MSHLTNTKFTLTKWLITETATIAIVDITCVCVCVFACDTMFCLMFYFVRLRELPYTQ